MIGAVRGGLDAQEVRRVAKVSADGLGHRTQGQEHLGEGRAVDLQDGVTGVDVIELHRSGVGVDDHFHRIAHVVEVGR